MKYSWTHHTHSCVSTLVADVFAFTQQNEAEAPGFLAGVRGREAGGEKRGTTDAAKDSGGGGAGGESTRVDGI